MHITCREGAYNLSIAGDDDVILKRTAVFVFSAEVNIGERYSDITLDAIDHIAVFVATQRNLVRSITQCCRSDGGGLFRSRREGEGTKRKGFRNLGFEVRSPSAVSSSNFCVAKVT